MIDPETLEVYDAQADEYAELTKRDGGSRQLLEFIAALPRSGRVLDLGCGPGHAAATMAKAGLNVDAWDASRSMIALASKHAGVTTRVASFDDLDAVSAYDGIYANFSLLHAPAKDFPRHLSQISRALRPNGVFHIGIKTRTGEHRDSIGRRYSYFTESQLEDMLTAAGLGVIARSTGHDAGLSGEVAPWVILLSKKDV